MNIVLEGPDNAGKTSLAEYLRGRVPDLKYHHPGGRPADVDAEIKCLTEQRNMMFDQDCTLFDRVTCISQQVYNPGVADDWQRRQFVEAMVGCMPNLLIVYCRPSNEALMDVGNFKWRPEETEEHKQKIVTRAHEFIERYDEVMLYVPCLHFNWQDLIGARGIKSSLVLALSGDRGALQYLSQMVHMWRKS